MKDDEREKFLDFKAEHMTEESDLEDPETGEISIVLHKHHWRSEGNSYRTAITAIFTFNINLTYIIEANTFLSELDKRYEDSLKKKAYRAPKISRVLGENSTSTPPVGTAEWIIRNL